MSITNIGADAAEESNTNNGSDQNESDYERFDLSGCSFGKQHPTTAVRGKAVALRRLYDENDRDRADVAVIMDDPSLVTEDDALAGGVVVQSEEEGDQFKVVDTDDDETKVLEGMGIDFSGNTFYGDLEDGFGDMTASHSSVVAEQAVVSPRPLGLPVVEQPRPRSSGTKTEPSLE